MTRPPILLLAPVLVLVLAAATAAVRADVNPHLEPARCDACHTKTPTAEEARAGEYFLLKDTIDETCNSCHGYKCCTTGHLHGLVHPTHVNTWDRERFQAPKSLPLFDGYLTCTTCHFYRRAQGDNPKLGRLAKIVGPRVDWTALCRDCHVNY